MARETTLKTQRMCNVRNANVCAVWLERRESQATECFDECCCGASHAALFVDDLYSRILAVLYARRLPSSTRRFDAFSSVVEPGREPSVVARVVVRYEC